MLRSSDPEFKEAYEIDFRMYDGKPVTKEEEDKVRAILIRCANEECSTGVTFWAFFAMRDYQITGE